MLNLVINTKRRGYNAWVDASQQENDLDVRVFSWRALRELQLNRNAQTSRAKHSSHDVKDYSLTPMTAEGVKRSGFRKYTND